MSELGLKGLPGPKKGVIAQELPYRREPRPAIIRRQQAHRAVADRHRRAPDRRGKDLLLRGARPLLAEGDRLGHRQALRVSSRHRRHQQGQSFPARAIFDGDPLGPRVPVHLLGFHRERPAPGTSSAPWAPSATARTATPRWNRSGAPCKLSSSNSARLGGIRALCDSRGRRCLNSHARRCLNSRARRDSNPQPSDP